MRAMILAAGRGTRLKPITDTLPKALVVVRGKTLLEHSILHLKSAGITEVIINVHHLAGMIMDFLSRNRNFGIDITISDEQDALLETGGGVKKAGWFLEQSDCAVVRNVDILSDLDLSRMARFHKEHKSLATLAVRDRPTSRYLLFNPVMQMAGWENRTTGERIITRKEAGYASRAFSGIQFISPEIFPLITEKGAFSLISLYLRLSENHPVFGFPDDASLWLDAGKPEVISQNP